MPEMTEHGIFTTRADYWVHFFPLEARMYWYNVALCRMYIQHSKPKQSLGHSKNGQATGVGFLVPRDIFFVQTVNIPIDWLSGFDWRTSTDRECGLEGQMRVMGFFSRGIITFPPLKLSPGSAVQELQSIDFMLTCPNELAYEVKTERVLSPNLYVQSGERGHNVHLAVENEQIVERRSAFTLTTEYAGGR